MFCELLHNIASIPKSSPGMVAGAGLNDGLFVIPPFLINLWTWVRQCKLFPHSSFIVWMFFSAPTSPWTRSLPIQTTHHHTYLHITVCLPQRTSKFVFFRRRIVSELPRCCRLWSRKLQGFVLIDKVLPQPSFETRPTRRGAKELGQMWITYGGCSVSRILMSRHTEFLLGRKYYKIVTLLLHPVLCLAWSWSGPSCYWLFMHSYLLATTTNEGDSERTLPNLEIMRRLWQIPSDN